MSFFSPTSNLSVRARMAFFERPKLKQHAEPAEVVAPPRRTWPPNATATTNNSNPAASVDAVPTEESSHSPIKKVADEAPRNPLSYLFEKAKPQHPKAKANEATARPRRSRGTARSPAIPVTSRSPLKGSEHLRRKPLTYIFDKIENQEQPDSNDAARQPRHPWPPHSTSSNTVDSTTRHPSPSAPSDESHSPRKVMSQSPRRPLGNLAASNQHAWSPLVRKPGRGTPRKTTPNNARRESSMPTKASQSPDALSRKSSPSPRKSLSSWTNIQNWSPSKWKKVKEEADECRAQNERLRSQMARLQHRISCLDSDTGRNELLEVLDEKDDEIDRKDAKLRVLDEKLHHIQLGLAQIEEERHVLKNKSAEMQNEKESMKKQLDNRENEINLLTRRCATEAEKVKESNQLRILNQSLQAQLTQLEASHGSSQQHAAEVKRLKHEVDQQERARQEMSELLTTLKSEHHIMTEKLRLSLNQVDTLMVEKREWEAQRHRWSHRAELDLQQQRLQHEESKIALETTLQSKEQEIQRLQVRLKESTDQLQRSRTTSTKIEVLQTECEQRLAELESSHEAQLKDYEQALNCAKSKVAEKNSTIASLREDVSKNLQQLMETTTTLHKLQDECQLMDSMMADIEALEEERSNLAEVLHERDTEIAEISAEILKLEIEKELMAQHKERADVLQTKLTKAEEEQLLLLASRETEAVRTRASIRQDVDATCELLRSQLQRSEQMSAEEELRFDMALTQKDETIELLKDQLGTFEMEQQRRAAQQDAEIVSLRQEIQKNTEAARLLTSTEAQLASIEQTYKEQIAILEKSVLMKDEKMESLFNDESQRRQEHQRSASIFQEEVEGLRQELQRAKTSLAVKDDEIRDLRIVELVDRDETIAGLEEQMRQLNDDLQAKQVASAKAVAELEQQVARQQASIADLQRVADIRRNEHQLAVDKLKQTVVDLKRENDFAEISLRDRERKLSDASASLENLQQRVQSLEQREGGLLAECGQLRTSLETLRRDRDKLSLALGNELEDRQSREQEDQESLGRVETLKNRLSVSETLLAESQAELHARETDLKEQSARLSDLMARNKKAEMELQLHGSRTTATEQDFEELQCRLFEKNTELQKLQREFQQKEEEYLDEIHTERTRSELTEADLAAAQARLDRISQDMKEQTELEKENAELKDKVRRQAAFLKRKIEKDRVLRTRSSTTASRLSGSPRKVAPPKFIRDTGTTVVSESSSADIDWELDDLLAD